MSDMIEVKVEELSGRALDWAAGKAQGHYCDSHPSTDWNRGGPLIQKYGVLLSPPKSMVHRNYGNFDERNGWYESGVWGATIFGNERKHRRRSFNHPDQPLVAAMRAIVQFELGDVVSVPAALVEGGTK